MRLIYSVKIGDYDIPEWVIDSHRLYAEDCGADYKLERETSYAYPTFRAAMLAIYSQMEEFNIINNYKIYLLNLYKEYDEILFLDLDVFVNTRENFFDKHPLSQGIALGAQRLPHDYATWVMSDMDSINTLHYNPSERSATVKYALVKSLLFMDGIHTTPKIWNSGVIGINREFIKKLNYFDNDFSSLCKEIVDMKDAGHMGFFAPRIQEKFTIHEEAILSYYTHSRNIPVQELSDDWHHMYWDNTLNRNAKFIHFINKRFNDL